MQQELFEIDSVIRGHHVYKDSWTPLLNEELAVCTELNNVYDRHAVSIQKDRRTVGHELAKLITKFLNKGGNAVCIVSGHRKKGKGLEVPCTYRFYGKRKLIRKLEKLLKKMDETSLIY